MAAIAQHNGVLKWTSGGLRDLSAGTVSATLNQQYNNSVYHVISTAAPAAMKGGYTWEVQAELLIETTATTPYGYVMATIDTTTAASIELYQPDASTSGSIKYSGNALLVGVQNAANMRGGEAAPATATARWVGAGALTKAAVV